MYIIIRTGGPRQPDHKIIYPGKCTLTYTNTYYTVDSLNIMDTLVHIGLYPLFRVRMSFIGMFWLNHFPLRIGCCHT